MSNTIGVYLSEVNENQKWRFEWDVKVKRVENGWRKNWLQSIASSNSKSVYKHWKKKIAPIKHKNKKTNL